MKQYILTALVCFVLWLMYAHYFLSSSDIEEVASPIVVAAREQIGVVTSYDNQYYAGGNPPADRGACTDVLLRAFDRVGINLKGLVDTDIHDYKKEYKINTPDPNIDARRVLSLKKYFERHAESLTLSLDDYSERKAGDIVVFDQIPGHLRHIAIVSSKKTKSGRPYIIHNYGFGTTENDMLSKRPTKIIGHFRMKLG